jgi:hypothetical protein
MDSLTQLGVNTIRPINGIGDTMAPLIRPLQMLANLGHPLCICDAMSGSRTWCGAHRQRLCLGRDLADLPWKLRKTPKPRAKSLSLALVLAVGGSMRLRGGTRGIANRYSAKKRQEVTMQLRHIRPEGSCRLIIAFPGTVGRADPKVRPRILQIQCISSQASSLGQDTRILALGRGRRV